MKVDGELLTDHLRKRIDDIERLISMSTNDLYRQFQRGRLDAFQSTVNDLRQFETKEVEL